MDDETLGRLREICLSFPETTERLSHGAPSFFVRGKSTFVNAWLEGHHADEFPHLWCAALPGVQHDLVEQDPELFLQAAICRPPWLDRGAARCRARLGRPGLDLRGRLPGSRAQQARGAPGRAARGRLTRPFVSRTSLSTGGGERGAFRFADSPKCAPREVVVDDAERLHGGVDGRRTDEPESS